MSTLAVNLIAHTGRFKQDMRESSRTVTTFGQKTTAVGKTLATAFVSYMVYRGARAFTQMIEEQIDVIDKLGHTAHKLGVGTKELSKWQYTAKMAGVETNTFNMALQRMTRRVAEAGMGTGEAKGAIAELGLDPKALARKSPDKALRDIAEAMRNVESQSDRVRLSFKLFDSEGVALVNLLNMSTDQWNKYADAVERAGVAVSETDVKLAQHRKEQATKAGMQWEGFKTQLALSGFGQGYGESKEMGGDIAEAWGKALQTWRSIGDLNTGRVKGGFLQYDQWQKSIGGTAKSLEALKAVAEQAAAKLKAETDARAANIKRIRAEDEAAWKRLGARGQAIAESQRTPWQNYQRELQQIRTMVHGPIKALLPEEGRRAREQALERLKAPGDALRAQLRTAAEQFEERLKKINDLWTGKHITRDERRRGFAMERAAFLEDQSKGGAAGAQLPRALQQGSLAAYEAIAKRNVERKIAENHLEEQRKTRQAVEAIERKFDLGEVVIPPA